MAEERDPNDLAIEAAKLQAAWVYAQAEASLDPEVQRLAALADQQAQNIVQTIQENTP